VWASSARERGGAGADAEAGSGGVEKGEYGGEGELGKRKRAGGGMGGGCAERLPAMEEVGDA